MGAIHVRRLAMVYTFWTSLLCIVFSLEIEYG